MNSKFKSVTRLSIVFILAVVISGSILTYFGINNISNLKELTEKRILEEERELTARFILALQLEIEAGNVSLLLTDSGPGIDESLRDKVFEPFFSTKASGEGTGLGLSLCRRLVEDHAGQLSLESSSEAGASFKLVLPLVEEKTL